MREARHGDDALDGEIPDYEMMLARYKEAAEEHARAVESVRQSFDMVKLLTESGDLEPAEPLIPEEDLVADLVRLREELG